MTLDDTNLKKLSAVFYLLVLVYFFCFFFFLLLLLKKGNIPMNSEIVSYLGNRRKTSVKSHL